jgi:RNA polymerase sigma-70 factor (ECF subfamily)
MPHPIPESTLILPLRETEQAEPAPKPSHVEEEVVDLFDQLGDRVLRYVFSLGLPVQHGEEIFQEAFLSLFQHLQRCKSRKNLRGWIFRVSHNLALKRRNQSLRDLADSMTGSDEHFIDPGANPEGQMEGRQKQQRLLGLRYREIAEVLNMSLGSVSLSPGRSLARLALTAER